MPDPMTGEILREQIEKLQNEDLMASFTPVVIRIGMDSGVKEFDLFRVFIEGDKIVLWGW